MVETVVNPLAHPDVFLLKRRLVSYCLEQGLLMRSEQEVDTVLMEEFGVALAHRFRQQHPLVYQQVVNQVMEEFRWGSQAEHGVLPFPCPAG